MPSSIDEEELQECQPFNIDQDLEPPTNVILEFVTSQGHSEDQHDQVLQTMKHINKHNLKLKHHLDK